MVLCDAPPGPTAATRASYTTPATGHAPSNAAKLKRILPSLWTFGLPSSMTCSGCVPADGEKAQLVLPHDRDAVDRGVVIGRRVELDDLRTNRLSRERRRKATRANQQSVQGTVRCGGRAHARTTPSMPSATFVKSTPSQGFAEPRAQPSAAVHDPRPDRRQRRTRQVRVWGAFGAGRAKGRSVPMAGERLQY